MRFFGDRREKPDRLRNTLALGHGKFVGYRHGLALFVFVDARACVHRIELDRAWMMAQGIERSLHFIARAVAKAGLKLQNARRN